MRSNPSVYSRRFVRELQSSLHVWSIAQAQGPQVNQKVDGRGGGVKTHLAGRRERRKRERQVQEGQRRQRTAGRSHGKSRGVRGEEAKLGSAEKGREVGMQMPAGSAEAAGGRAGGHGGGGGEQGGEGTGRRRGGERGAPRAGRPGRGSRAAGRRARGGFRRTSCDNTPPARRGARAARPQARAGRQRAPATHTHTKPRRRSFKGRAPASQPAAFLPDTGDSLRLELLEKPFKENGIPFLY
ncbi:translation initiation factor IF-2-like [Camelus ferus]|uniref:Translation initiation factor IF-2-like n=1 Tax=Camelus ferus TaxID=419612 RepID=A0A8B8S294_CAMFR|nr:translation initiation factor IF-2-like [Camelus ferus]XP_032323758.1 translation initiation factor IF-2-like [Camelus ferus]